MIPEVMIGRSCSDALSTARVVIGGIDLSVSGVVLVVTVLSFILKRLQSNTSGLSRSQSHVQGRR